MQGFFALGAAAALAVATARPTVAQSPNDSGAVARRLAGAVGPARIPLLVRLAGLRRDDPAEAIRLADEALALIASHPAVPEEIIARTIRAFALQVQSDYPAALAEAERAERLAENAGVDSLSAEAAYHVGLVEWRLARYEEALQHGETARRLAAPRGATITLAKTLNLIGGIHQHQGDLRPALEWYLAALRTSEAAGEERLAAASHNNIGLVYWDLRRFDEALAALQRALAIHTRAGPRLSLANTLNNIGLVLAEMKRPREAIPYLEQALGLDRQAGNRHGEGKTLSNLGWCAFDLKRWDEALRYHDQAMAIRRQIGDRDGIVRSSGALAEVHLAQGNPTAALALLNHSVALVDSIRDRLGQVDQLEMLSRARAAAGDSGGALIAFRRSQEIKSQVDDSTNRRQIADLETRYRTRERERDLAAAQRLAAARQRELRWAVGGSALLAIGILLIALLYRARIRSARALAESERRYRALFQTSADPAFVIEHDSRTVIDRNEAARSLLGGGTTLPSPVDRLHPDWLRAAVSRPLEPAAADPFEQDDSWPEASGRIRRTATRAWKIAFGGRAGWLVTVRDITEARDREEARQREDKMRSLGVLAGGIAHDFNNVLTAVIGHIALARDLVGPERDAMLDGAEAAATRASGLTAQLLTFARGGAPLRRPTSIEPLLREAADEARDPSRLTIEFAIAGDVRPAQVDPGQFSQVVANLVRNAQEAVGPAGGRLVIRAANATAIDAAANGMTPANGPAPIGEPDPEAAAGPRFVRIDFADDGPGIPAPLQSQVFDPYFSTKPGHSGLGLTTAFAICRAHGGALTIQSRNGAGSTVSAFVPAAAEAPAAPAPPPRAPAGTGSILVLDDEPLVRNVIERALVRRGYAVEAVADGRTAVERYLTRLRGGTPFDLLIMDLTIPGGMGGRQAMAEILRHDSAARAIVASGYSDDPTMANHRAAGFLAALAKPFEPKSLIQLVEEIMAEARAGQ